MKSDEGIEYGRFSSRQLVLLFAAGIVTCLFSNGSYNIPVFAWIWPACLLAAFRGICRKRILAAAAAVLLLMHVFRLWGFTGGGALGDGLSGVLIGIMVLLALLLDRAFYFRLKERLGAASVLLFPCVYTALNVLGDLVISVNRLGYTQTGNLPLMQAAAVIGSYGLTFLITCFASVVLYRIENEREKKSARPLVVYGTLMVAIVAIGGARLACWQTTGDYTMTVASVLTPAQGDYLAGTLTVPTLEEDLHYLESMAEQAEAGGADLLCTAEEAFELDDTEVEKLMEDVSRIAKEHQLWMLVGFDEGDTDGSNQGLRENKEYLISGDGTVVGTYTKTCLVPVEAVEFVKGDGEILSAEIPLKNGKTVTVSSVICFDGNNSRYVSRMDDSTDVLLVPSWCWDGCDLYQKEVHRFRAVENGVSLVSSTIAAKSLAVDRQGNVMSCTDEDSRGRDSLCFAYVPVDEDAGRTVYHYIAPYLDWSYLLGAAILIGAAVSRKKENAGAAS